MICKRPLVRVIGDAAYCYSCGAERGEPCRRAAELYAQADQTIRFYQADPQGIGTTKPCECAQKAIDTGFMALDPDCQANRCKELRA